ncbi:integrating conjugative element protein [Vibrio vulnificus]
MNKFSIVVVVACTLSLPVSAYTVRDKLEPVLDSGPWYYEVGGAMYLPVPNVDRAAMSMGAGIAWNGNLMCSNLDPMVSIDGFMNGVKEGWMRLQRNAIGTFKGVVSSLPGLVLQHADPGLYEMLSTGFLRAEEIFNLEIANCRDITRDLATSNPNFDYIKLSGSGDLSRVFNYGGKPKPNVDKDAGRLMDETEENLGRSGVDWVCDEKAGGDGQRPIISTDVPLAVFNQLAGRSDPCDLSELTSDEKQKAPTYAALWDSPEKMVDWYVAVLGKKMVKTTPSEKPVESVVGTGLLQQVQNTFEEVSSNMSELLSSSTPPTLAELRKVSFSENLVSRATIESLRRDPNGHQLAQRLALDVAVEIEMNRATTLRRMLISGKDLEVVAAQLPSQKMVDEAVARLNTEISLLREDMAIRRELLSSTMPLILERERNRQNAYINEVDKVSKDSGGL